MYFGRTDNAAIETALTQTGSPNGDLNFFLRLQTICTRRRSAISYVLAGDPASMVKPGAVEFARTSAILKSTRLLQPLSKHCRATSK